MTYTQIPYSGGTHYTPGQTGFGNYPDTLSNGSYGGSSGGGTYSDCSGAITTSWIWVPATGLTMTTDPPPAQVIIMQTCSVQVGLGQPGGSGTYDDGLGTSGSASFNPPTSTGGSGTDTHYSVQTGGATVTLTAVNGKAHVTNAPSSASLSYTATISPIFVNPSGAIKDSSGTYNILIGQGCLSIISVIPDALLNNPTNPPVYAWSIHGTTFQKWGVTANDFSAVLLSGPGPLNQATAHWYWNEAATTETVSRSVTLTPPAGQGTAFIVTPSVQVAVTDPSYSCTQIIGASYVSADGTLLKAIGASNANPRGNTWICNVQTPTLFGSGGSCNFCQLITPGRSHTYPSGIAQCTQNGKQGLDTVMPYPSLPSTMSDGDPYTVGSGITEGWPTDGTQHHDGDSPKTLLLDNDLGIAAGVSVNESYYTTLMYIPPGNDAQPVSLHELDWKWAATVVKPAGGWARVNGFPAGSVTPTGAARLYLQPTWSLLESPSVGSGW